jgi:prepilin-type N-terminal cleavage/methylation domain-containing protein
MVPRPPRRRRRGFSLLEVVIVIALMGILMAVTMPRLRTGSTAALDRASQVNVDAALAAELRVFRSLGAFVEVPADPSEPDHLADAQPDLTFRGPATAPSGPSEVSVAVDGSAVGVTSSAGETCWLARVDFAPPPGSPRALYAWRADPDGCHGLLALSLVPAGTQGRAWSDPLVVP